MRRKKANRNENKTNDDLQCVYESGYVCVNEKAAVHTRIRMLVHFYGNEDDDDGGRQLSVGGGFPRNLILKYK